MKIPGSPKTRLDYRVAGAVNVSPILPHTERRQILHEVAHMFELRFDSTRAILLDLPPFISNQNGGKSSHKVARSLERNNQPSCALAVHEPQLSVSDDSE